MVRQIAKTNWLQGQQVVTFQDGVDAGLGDKRPDWFFEGGGRGGLPSEMNADCYFVPISRVLLSSLDMREGPHLFCSVILGRCLACAFELGPHVFPFIPSAGTAQSFYNKSGWLFEQSYISGVSMLRLYLVRANSTLFSAPQNYLPSPATHTLLRAVGAGQGCQGPLEPPAGW